MNNAHLFVESNQPQRNDASENVHKVKDDPYEHSRLSAIMAHLSYEYADFKYTVYRCSAKFVTLQKILHTGSIPFKLVMAILERHHIKNVDANFMVPPFQLTAIIHDIFYACEKLGHFANVTAFCLETATAVLSNFFWNIFDPQRSHSISFLEIMVTFLMLCKVCPSDMLVAEFHKLIIDAKTKCVPKLKFEYLLDALTKLITYIGEGAAYGAQNVPLIMEQCFARCLNRNGLTEHQFHAIWTSNETRFIIYANLIALIKRIEDTKKLVHNNACASCRVEKIIGIRFKCQVCRNVSLCLKCFATGYATNKHVPGHRMYEVFADDPPPKKLSHYFSKLCNMFFKTNIEETQWFCNSNETGNANETELVTILDMQCSSNVSTLNAAAAANVQQRIQAVDQISKLEPSVVCLSGNLTNSSHSTERMQQIIDRLLQQNAKIEHQIKMLKTATTEEISTFLTAHQNFLIDIINEMRNLSNSSRCISAYPTSSTPNRSIVSQQNIVLKSFKDVNLSHSMNGADLNRSYLDANKSDYSVADLSSWFNQRRMSMPPTGTGRHLSRLIEDDPAAIDLRETEMMNFKLLLNKVKEIVEDSCSDNTELSAATQNLENVLDNIIRSEESRRKST